VGREREELHLDTGFEHLDTGLDHRSNASILLHVELVTRGFLRLVRGLAGDCCPESLLVDVQRAIFWKKGVLALGMSIPRGRGVLSGHTTIATAIGHPLP